MNHRPPARVAVLGAGTMGGGITITLVLLLACALTILSRALFSD